MAVTAKHGTGQCQFHCLPHQWLGHVPRTLSGSQIRKAEHLGHEPTCAWNAGVAVGTSARYATMPVFVAGFLCCCTLVRFTFTLQSSSTDALKVFDTLFNWILLALWSAECLSFRNWPDFPGLWLNKNFLEIWKGASKYKCLHLSVHWSNGSNSCSQIWELGRQSRLPMWVTGTPLFETPPPPSRICVGEKLQSRARNGNWTQPF